jgi:hypothetical protein
MTSKATMKRRADEYAASLPVKGIERVDIRKRTAVERACASERCPFMTETISVGDAYVRVIYDPADDRTPEDFHDSCYRWEFEQ